MTKRCRTPRARSSRVTKPVAAAGGRHATTRSRTVVLPIPGGPVMSRLVGGFTRMSQRRLAPRAMLACRRVLFPPSARAVDLRRFFAYGWPAGKEGDHAGGSERGVGGGGG